MALHLSTHSLDPIALAASPVGGTPSSVEFTLTSSGGPFTILGFYVNPLKRDEPAAGRVQIGLSRINGEGVIHAQFELADAFGVRPQDLVVSYGSVMSSSFSLSFEVIQFPPNSGTGSSFDIVGNIVFLAEHGATLKVTLAAE